MVAYSFEAGSANANKEIDLDTSNDFPSSKHLCELPHRQHSNGNCRRASIWLVQFHADVRAPTFARILFAPIASTIVFGRLEESTHLQISSVADGTPYLLNITASVISSVVIGAPPPHQLFQSTRTRNPMKFDASLSVSQRDLNLETALSPQRQTAAATSKDDRNLSFPHRYYLMLAASRTKIQDIGYASGFKVTQSSGSNTVDVRYRVFIRTAGT